MAGKKKANGEGNIYQRTDGRWLARLTLPDGKRKCFCGKTRKEVQQQLTAALRDLQHGVLPVPAQETTAQFLERWLVDVVKPSVRPRTFEAYSLNVRRLLPHLGRLRLIALTSTIGTTRYGSCWRPRGSAWAKPAG